MLEIMYYWRVIIEITMWCWTEVAVPHTPYTASLCWTYCAKLILNPSADCRIMCWRSDIRYWETPTYRVRQKLPQQYMRLVWYSQKQQPGRMEFPAEVLFSNPHPLSSCNHLFCPLTTSLYSEYLQRVHKQWLLRTNCTFSKMIIQNCKQCLYTCKNSIKISIIKYLPKYLAVAVVFSCFTYTSNPGRK